MEKFTSLDLLFEIELRHLYNIEKQCREDLSRIFNVAVSSKLKQLLDRNILESRLQIQRLDKAFELLNINPNRSTLHGMRGVKNILREGYVNLLQQSTNISKGMHGILSEGYEILRHFVDTQASDIALISNEQKIAKFEIAWYRFLCDIAEKHAAFGSILGLLRLSLKEKEESYHRFSELNLEEIHSLESTVHDSVN